MRQKIARTKELFTEFVARYEAFCDAMDAANAAIEQYNTEARIYMAAYNENVEKIEGKLKELSQEMKEIDKKVIKARTGWTEAALNDGDVTEFDAEIEKQLMQIKVLQIKQKALENMKVPEDAEQLMKVKKCHEAAKKLGDAAIEARSEARSAVEPLLRDLEENYGRIYSINCNFASIDTYCSMEEIDKLMEDAATMKEAIEHAAEIRSAAAKARNELMQQAKRFAEIERQARIKEREKELINTEADLEYLNGNIVGGTLVVDGETFIRNGGKYSSPEWKTAGSLLLHDYLDKTMPLSEEDYRNGGFRTDGERY